VYVTGFIQSSETLQVEGKDWERQRRLTAPSFNEKTSSLVWYEAIRQSEDMAASWLGQAAKGTTEVASDTATLALHVLTCVGFGLSYPFHAGVRKLPAGHSMTYRDALSLCLRNIITFALFPKKYLSLSFLPEKLRLLGQATREFQRYMEEMLAHERDVTQKSEGRVSNLMGALVRASDETEQSIEESTPSSHGLSDDEIFGNIFAFNLAGHETTANTVAAAIVLLAANPEYQIWLAEELQHIFGQNTDPKDFSYEEAFPKLQRCMAVMVLSVSNRFLFPFPLRAMAHKAQYETLRLYGSIVFIPKTTNLHPQTLSLHNKEYLLPPNTAVNINVQALHTSPKTWAPDPLTWRPKRWLHQPTAGSPIGTEHFIDPNPGTYIPWAAGPRVCVGRKFSQVEFVAVMATLFQQNRVRPALRPGQSEEEGRRALMDMVEESAITFITLQMREPGRVPLVWEKRP